MIWWYCDSLIIYAASLNWCRVSPKGRLWLYEYKILHYCLVRWPSKTLSHPEMIKLFSWIILYNIVSDRIIRESFLFFTPVASQFHPLCHVETETSFLRSNLLVTNQVAGLIFLRRDNSDAIISTHKLRNAFDVFTPAVGIQYHHVQY